MLLFDRKALMIGVIDVAPKELLQMLKTRRRTGTWFSGRWMVSEMGQQTIGLDNATCSQKRCYEFHTQMFEFCLKTAIKMLICIGDCLFERECDFKISGQSL